MNRGSEPERIDYHPPSTWASDYQVLKSMMFADVKGDTQQERLESFYVSQADLYDSYRHRMLHGRFPMINAMPAPKDGVWVDIGGGTGSNLNSLGIVLIILAKWLCSIYVKHYVLLQGRECLREGGVILLMSSAVTHVTSSARDYLKAGTVDVVTFSYALSMIPDWRKAIQNAFRLLKPGGYIAVCDFTVSKEQWPGMGNFWTWVFAHDHVHLKKEHIPTLQAAFTQMSLDAGFGEFLYVPFFV